MPWPLSKAVMGPTWAPCSPEAVGVIISQGARVGVCGRVSECEAGAHGRRAVVISRLVLRNVNSAVALNRRTPSPLNLAYLFTLMYKRRRLPSCTSYTQSGKAGLRVSEEERGWGKRERSHL